jgi:hypothetical protein
LDTGKNPRPPVLDRPMRWRVRQIPTRIQGLIADQRQISGDDDDRDRLLRTALRSGIYKARKPFDLMVFADHADNQARRKIGPTIEQILAYATKIDGGVAKGPEGQAFLNRIATLIDGIDPSTNPILRLIPGSKDVTVSELLGWTRVAGFTAR